MSYPSNQFLEFSRNAEASFSQYLPKYVAVDTETEGVAFHDKPFCVSIAWTEEKEGTKSYYLELGIPEVEDMVKHILAEAPNLVFHNAKFDLQKLALVGLIDLGERDPLSVWDTECLYHLLDEHGLKGLKHLAKLVLHEETDEEEVLKVERRKQKLRKADGYHLLPREVIIPYAIKDAEFTIRLFDKLYPRVQNNKDLSELVRLEQRLTFTLLRMESRGMGLDIGYVEATAKEYATKALAQELLIRDITGLDEFNPQSPKQIGEFFAAKGIDLNGTDKATLKHTNHPLAQSILALRTLRKMHGTYLKPMLVEQKGGVIHPWFRQHGTRTGRMSSGGAGTD